MRGPQCAGPPSTVWALYPACGLSAVSVVIRALCAYAYGYVHRLSLLKMNDFGPKSAELTASKPSPPLGDTMVARMEFRENSCYHTGPTAVRIAY